MRLYAITFNALHTLHCITHYAHRHIGSVEDMSVGPNDAGIAFSHGFGALAAGLSVLANFAIHSRQTCFECQKVFAFALALTHSR
jgi:hypothetical protein